MNMGKSTALAEVDPSTASGSVLENGVQVVESELTASTYPNIVVKAGTPVRWNLKAPAGTINGCNNRIVIPSLGKEVSLKEGDNIIEFTPQSAGVIQYTCWMGMIRAQIWYRMRTAISPLLQTALPAAPMPMAAYTPVPPVPAAAAA